MALNLKNIDSAFPSWKDLDDDIKLMHYIEFAMHLPQVKKWDVKCSSLISNNKDKLNKVHQITSDLNNGINIWDRLSYKTIKAYLNLPKTLEERAKIAQDGNPSKLLGKDLLSNLFNIRHLRIDKSKSNTKVKIFDQNVHFVEQKSDESLYAMFDDKFSTVYFLDILTHKELYKYNKLLQTIHSSDIPRPYHICSDLAAANENDDFTDDEYRGLLCNGSSTIFRVNDHLAGKGHAAIPLNLMTTSGFTDKVIRVFNSVRAGEELITLPSDFIYSEEKNNGLYQLKFKL